MLDKENIVRTISRLVDEKMNFNSPAEELQAEDYEFYYKIDQLILKYEYALKKWEEILQEVSDFSAEFDKLEDECDAELLDYETHYYGPSSPFGRPGCNGIE